MAGRILALVLLLAIACLPATTARAVPLANGGFVSKTGGKGGHGRAKKSAPSRSAPSRPAPPRRAAQSRRAESKSRPAPRPRRIRRQAPPQHPARRSRPAPHRSAPHRSAPHRPAPVHRKASPPVRRRNGARRSGARRSASAPTPSPAIQQLIAHEPPLTDPSPRRRRSRPERRAGDRPSRRPRSSPVDRAQARVYLGARELIERDPYDGALTATLAHNLGLARDPGVRRAARRIEERRGHRAVVRSQARTYLHTRRHLRDDSFDGALTATLAHNLGLAGDPEVRDVAERIVERRRARRERRARRRLRRARARTYLAARGQVERDPYNGALTAVLAHNLALGRDPRIRRTARRIEHRRALAILEERIQTELDGLPLADLRDVGIAIPFDGGFLAIDVGCTKPLSPAGKTSCLDRPGKPRGTSVDLDVNVIERSARGQPFLTDDGREYLRLELSTDMRTALSAEGDLPRGVELTLQRFLGREMRYQVTVTPERADAIAAGEEPPNPLDPRSLHEGEGIMLSREDYVGNDFGASYRLLRLELGYREGERVSSGVQRLGPNTVRIYVGDEDVVTNALALGIGTDDLGVAVGLANELAQGRLHTVDLNVGNRAGWNAYQRFVTTGVLPASDRRGVRDSAGVDQSSWSSTQSFELRLGPVTAGDSSVPSEGKVTETRHSDGSTDYALSDRQREVTVLWEVSETPGGRVRDKRFSLLLQGAHAEWVEGVLALRGDDRSFDRRQNLMLDFSEADLEELREEATQQLARATIAAGNPMTPEQIEGVVRGDPGAHLPTATTPDYFLMLLAAAEAPQRVLEALYVTSRGSSTELLENLQVLQIAPAGPDGESLLSPAHRPNPYLPGDVTVLGPTSD